MQAVALPEAKEVTEAPGKLPEPDKVTKAYFEVSLRSPHQNTWLTIAKLHHHKGALLITYELAVLLLLPVLLLSLMLVLRSCAHSSCCSICSNTC